MTQFFEYATSNGILVFLGIVWLISAFAEGIATIIKAWKGRSS